MSTTYLYILESLESDRIRIGMSYDPKTRAAYININSSHKVKIAHTVRYETRGEADAEERRFHKDMRRAGYHIHHSWYRCTVSEALDVLDHTDPRSLWPKGSRHRVPSMLCNLPLSDSTIEEEVREFKDHFKKYRGFKF